MTHTQLLKYLSSVHGSFTDSLWVQLQKSRINEKKKNIWDMKGSRDVFVSYFEESGSSEIIWEAHSARFR